MSAAGLCVLDNKNLKRERKKEDMGEEGRRKKSDIEDIKKEKGE